MSRLSLHTFYPGSDVRGLGRYGAVASQSSSPAELQARMQGMINNLRSTWASIKAQILAGKYTGALDSNVSGLQTIDNIIAMKEKSMMDVLGGQLTLEKWINGVEVARAEIISYGKYVGDNTSVLRNLEQLGADLKQTASDYGTTFVKVAKVAGAAAGVGVIGLVVFAGLLLWKLGPTLAAMYLPGPRRLSDYKRPSRRRRWRR